MRTFSSLVIFLALVPLLASCSDRSTPPPACTPGVTCEPDASVADTGVDSAVPDAAEDAAMDATMDAAVDSGPIDAGPLTGDSYVFVTDVLDVGAADPMGDPLEVFGFDLDGRVSDATDLMGCRKVDRRAPPPDSFDGVDNELGPLLSQSEASFGFIANLHTVVRTGELLLLLRLRGVDDLTNDDRVELDLLFGQLTPGTFAPATSIDGRFVAGQTFDVLADSFDAAGDARIVLPGQIVDGRVRGSAGDFTLSIPFMGRAVPLQMAGVRVRFNVSTMAFDTGVLGGGLDVDTTVAALVGGGVDESLARLVLEGAADLQPDMRNRCQSVSVGLVLAGVPAVLGDTVAAIP